MEDPLILAIRTNLQKEHLSVQDFIDCVQKICELRNIMVHEKGLTEDERQEAIKIWRERTPFNAVQNTKGMIILLRKPELTPLIEYQDSVTTQVNGMHPQSLFILLIIYYSQLTAPPVEGIATKTKTCSFFSLTCTFMGNSRFLKIN